MSISSLMIAASRGDTRFIGLPVFTSRRFFHTRILVRRDSGIKSPADLRGKKVGVPEYHQTAVMWIRGVLQDEFGVGMQDMQIWTERAPGGSLASALGFKPPSYVKQIPPEKNIGAMMLSGELDAALTYIQTRDPQPLGDRSTADLMGSPQVTMLFPDQRAEGIRYFEKTGMHHINHCMVMRRSLFEQDASLPRAVVGLFDKAAAAVDAERLAHVEYHYEEGRLDEPTYKALAVPVVRHGVAPNRRLLETMCRYSHQQALSTRLMTLPELFPGTDA
jgi:4,5-dihydroxyphthalate decarboxylase